MFYCASLNEEKPVCNIFFQMIFFRADCFCNISDSYVINVCKYFQREKRSMMCLRNKNDRFVLPLIWFVVWMCEPWTAGRTHTSWKVQLQDHHMSAALMILYISIKSIAMNDWKNILIEIKICFASNPFRDGCHPDPVVSLLSTFLRFWLRRKSQRESGLSPRDDL